MFLDEVTITARAGKGGEGCVHFARRKYQPFGGPDGGDGGDGGSVLLVADRSRDSLDNLRYQRIAAVNGGPGGPNLMIGANAADLLVPVPPGTLAYEAQSGFELGSVTVAGEQLLIAQGGKGGRGNTQFATARRRAPKTAQPGIEGETPDILLRYRIFAGTALIEPHMDAEGEPELMLLPRILDKPAELIDFELYRRKPRWVRLEHDYQLHDSAYLPILWDAERTELTGYVDHAYWAENVVLNLAPLGGAAAACWQELRERLEGMAWRELHTVTCLLPEAGQVEPDYVNGIRVQLCTVASVEDAYAVLADKLTGGTVG